MENEKIGILGAGIQGVCTALYLQKKGYDITLFDRDQPGNYAASYGNAEILIGNSLRKLEKVDKISISDWVITTKVLPRGDFNFFRSN